MSNPTLFPSVSIIGTPSLAATGDALIASASPVNPLAIITLSIGLISLIFSAIFILVSNLFSPNILCTTFFLDSN